MIYQHLDRWKITAARAVASGGSNATSVHKVGRVARLGVPRVRWNVAGRCLRPVYREHVGSAAMRKPGSVVKVHQRGPAIYDRGPSHVLEMDVRCRQCVECLKARARHWKLRAQAEIKATEGRTWFGTLTLRPDAHFKAVSRARLRLAAQGIDFDRLDAKEQFSERVREIGPEITLWLKRVRKESGALLRYILVVEAHKSGLPHFHCLIHEVLPEGPVGERTLRKQWTGGFSMFKLVAQGINTAANYVTKYLTKSAISRVRASKGYGQRSQTLDDLNHRIDPQGEIRERKIDPPKNSIFMGTAHVSVSMAGQLPVDSSGAVEARLSTAGAAPYAGKRQSLGGERQFCRVGEKIQTDCRSCPVWEEFTGLCTRVYDYSPPSVVESARCDRRDGVAPS